MHRVPSSTCVCHKQHICCVGKPPADGGRVVAVMISIGPVGVAVLRCNEYTSCLAQLSYLEFALV